MREKKSKEKDTEEYLDEIPNEITIEAMKEAERIAKDKNVKRYYSVEEAIKALNK